MAAKLWRELGCDISVYAEPPLNLESAEGIDFQFRFYARPPFQGSDHFFPGDKQLHFENVLRQSGATHVFFLGMAYNKARFLFHTCQKSDVKMIAMWWTQDFYCANGYGTLPDGPCNRCVEGTFSHSLLNHCTKVEGIQKYIRLAYQTVSRSRLRQEIFNCEALLGSSSTQLRDYERYGVPPDRIVHCPLFFPRERLDGIVPSRGKRFIYYGQARFEKGFHLLRSIFQHCSKARFVLPFSTEEQATKAVAEHDLAEFIQGERIQVVSNMTWSSGLAELVASSRGVVIPSLWPSTTEYVLLEALGLAKPVIAFQVGIHADVLTSGQNGFVVPVGHIDEFAASLDRLADDDSLCDHISIGAKELYYSLTDPLSCMKAFQKALHL